jgi:HSP20 family protein
MKIVKSKNKTPFSRSFSHPFGDFPQEFNSLFERFFEPTQFWGNREDNFKLPSLEIKERPDEYQVRAEIPGLRDEDIDLSISNNTLEISGERKQENTEDKDGKHFSEFYYGKFFRTVPFDKEIDNEKVAASLQDGILSITLKKLDTAKNQARKIQIKS